MKRWTAANPRPPRGERHPGRSENWCECRACGQRFDSSIVRSTDSVKFCTSTCYEWDRLHPGVIRSSGRTCGPCGLSIDHRRFSANTCGARRCMWWALKHPGQALPANRKCVACDTPIDHLGLTARSCSSACKAWVKLYPGGSKKRPLTRSCGKCGVDISSRGSRAIYCSETCREGAPPALAKARASAKRRRATLDGNLCIPFTDEQLAARLMMWGGCCYICSSTDRVTVDHVKPVVHAGPHMLANFRPMCKSCNAIKLDSWPIPRDLLLRHGDPRLRREMLRATRRAYGRAKREAGLIQKEAG
jgi:hypothetical protein